MVYLALTHNCALLRYTYIKKNKTHKAKQFKGSLFHKQRNSIKS